MKKEKQFREKTLRDNSINGHTRVKMDPIFDALAALAGRRKLFGFMSSSSSSSSSNMDDSQCGDNSSGHGECLNGSCYCQIRFEGTECKRINFSYHVAFASIHFLLALVVLIQLVMCIHAGSFVRFCLVRIWTPPRSIDA